MFFFTYANYCVNTLPLVTTFALDQHSSTAAIETLFFFHFARRWQKKAILDVLK